jgi:hypothetical protein
VRVLLALIGLGLFLPAVADARPPCGPAHARTLARAGDARLYKDGARAYGCVRGTRAVLVGVRVTRVRLAGDFAAVVHANALTVYDLRQRRVNGARRLNLASSTVRGLALTATGDAAWIEDGAHGRRAVRDSVWGTRDIGRNIDPAFVHLAGSALSWIKGGYVKLSDHGYASAGSLGNVGGVELGTGDRGFTARYRQGRMVYLGGAIDALRVAGSVVATRYTDAYAGSKGFVSVYDLIRGGGWRVCETRQVTNFVVTAGGAVACVTSDGTNRIVSEGAVLDEGDAGVTGLRELHGRLVWRHGRDTRTAPLPPARIPEVRYPCGPANAGTFALTDTARVFASGGRARACHMGAANSPVLGAAAPIGEVMLKGDFAGVRRAAGTGESLRVYSVSSGREIGPGAVAPGFAEVQLSPAGVAVFIAHAVDQGRIGDTLGTTYTTGLYPWGLRLVGGVVSWFPAKTPDIRELAQLAHGAIQAPDEDGELLGRRDAPGVSIGVEHRRLVARLNGGAPVDIAAPPEIELIQGYDTFAQTVNRGGVVTLYDLASGTVTRRCPGSAGAVPC